jgi:TPR repeat protein
MTRLRRRAAAGDPDAMCRLGEVYREHGDPDEVDQIEGLWRRAASAGHPAAMLHLADLLRELVDEAEDGGEDDLHLEDHLTWYQRAARQGNVEAMTALAWELYFFGDDEPGTLAEAKNWWRAAAEAGSPTAMSLLGTTAHDPHEEERWLRRAATQHDTTAMYNLGSLLASRDDPASVAEGHAWWRRAAEAGSVEAMRQLSRLLRERGDQGSLREADEWEHRAADEKEPSEVSIAAAAQELGCDKQAARRVLAAHDLLVGARVTATWEELELLAIELEIRAMELDSPDNGADDEPNS